MIEDEGINTFVANVAHDGLKNKQEIKVMICFLINFSPEPITKDELLTVLMDKQIANYFEICNELQVLIDKGTVVYLEDNKNLSLNEKGVKVACDLYKKLPLTAREKACASAMRLISRRRSERENLAEITPINGGCQVSCSIMSENHPIMAVSLFVPDESYAQKIVNTFHDKPTELYKTVLSLLTKEDLSHMD